MCDIATAQEIEREAASFEELAVLKFIETLFVAENLPRPLLRRHDRAARSAILEERVYAHYIFRCMQDSEFRHKRDLASPGEGPVVETRRRYDYSASRENVESVLEWLRSNDEVQWEEQTRLLFLTIFDLEQMAQATTRRDETGSRSVEPDFFSPEANAINVAMPELMNMMNAMRGRNRAAAIESGEAALALLPERP